MRKRTKKSNLNLDFYLTLLNLLKQGKNPSKISKDLNISIQKLQYYLNKLKQKGLIKKIGYGVWEVKHCNLSYPKFKSKEIRGHAFIWMIKLPQEIKDWKEYLNKRQISYNLIGKEKYPRIYVKGLKVWLCHKNIVIFENKSFYAPNSINARKYAVFNLISILKALERVLCVNLKPYIFKPKREHYGMIKNELARQYNNKGEKLIVHDDLEGDWLWIDDSESLNELEIGGKKAITRSKQVQNWWNDNKKHNFEITPTFLMHALKNLAENQAENQIQVAQFSHQIKSHLKLIQEYRKENIRWRKGKIKEIKEELKEGFQKTIFDFNGKR